MSKDQEQQPVNQDPLGIGPVPGATSSAKPVIGRQIPVPPSQAMEGYQKTEPQAFTPIYSEQGGARGRSGGGAPRDYRQIAGYIYTGQNLVGESGVIERAPYEPMRDSITELSKLDATDRSQLLNDLYNRGFYEGKRRPSETGLEPADQYAMGNLLDSANTEYGRTWKVALKFVRQDYPGRGGAGGRRTPRQDIRATLDDRAVEALGRKFTNEEVNSLIAQIQQRESAGDKTSLGTMAEAAVAGAAQPEQQAFRFAQVADLFNEMLRTG
jgi:hypothetical protein